MVGCSTTLYFATLGFDPYTTQLVDLADLRKRGDRLQGMCIPTCDYVIVNSLFIPMETFPWTASDISRSNTIYSTIS
jgi:hypothetical protein